LPKLSIDGYSPVTSEEFEIRERELSKRLATFDFFIFMSVVECFETVCGVIERRLGVIWVGC